MRDCPWGGIVARCVCAPPDDKESEAVKLKGLDIILTYDCTGRCAHCCYRAGPGQGGTMTVEEVASYLDAVADQPLEWILLFGGEPFLCYDLLRECIPLAASLAQQVYVFTNGYWAADPATARRLLAGLQEAGLDYVLFSVDAFHQERIPLERIAIGIEAARELGYRTIDVDNCCLGEPEMDNVYNQHTRDNMARLAELCDLSGVNVDQGPARMVGRAADELTPLIAPQDTPMDRCPMPDYLGGDLRAPTGVEIHPGGWVDFCAGLARWVTPESAPWVRSWPHTIPTAIPSSARWQRMDRPGCCDWRGVTDTHRQAITWTVATCATRRGASCIPTIRPTWPLPTPT